MSLITTTTTTIDNNILNKINPNNYNNNSDICPVTTIPPIPASNNYNNNSINNKNQEDKLVAEQSILKRHSTITSIHDESSVTNTKPPRLRHYSTGYTLKSTRKLIEDKERVDLMKRSEEFQKELTTRRKTFKRLSRLLQDDNDDKVLMGTRISEGHRNYVLMYNMLTGIRIAVSRVTAKMDRELVDEDFMAAHKLAFDVIGDELTPGAKYDFKFKDYAPWVFRHLREKFGVDPADYLVGRMVV